jgi:hypothetical protein
VPVQVLVTDPDGDPVTVTATSITQDEPVKGSGDVDDLGIGVSASREDHCPDATIDGGAISLRAERSGSGTGRVYHIGFTATDALGVHCDGSVSVCVPHDDGGTSCVDEGLGVKSLGPCPDGHILPEALSTSPLRLALRVARTTPGEVMLEYTLPRRGEATLDLYDVVGRRVMSLAGGSLDAGLHQAVVRRGDVPSGVYYSRLRAGGASVARILVMTR